MTVPSNSANGAMLSAQPTEIETSTGTFVDLANPDPATIRLDDIAQGLSLTCRYGGQITRFYSVAEHSALVHDLLAWQNAPEDVRVAGLFHDAAESYLGDLVAPLKYALRSGPARASTYDHLSDRMDAAITARYDLNLAALYGQQLRTADMWALRIEARRLTHTGGREWRWPGTLPNDGYEPLGLTFAAGADPATARGMWLNLVNSYGIADDA